MLNINAHLRNQVTSLATCWKLQLKSGLVLGFTGAQDDLELDGIIYLASQGLDSSAIMSSSDLSVDNMELGGILNSDIITEEDILAGRYDYAELEIFMINYQDHNQGKIMLKKGWLGEVVLKGGKFTAELRSLVQKLSSSRCHLYSASCRANFADGSCQLKALDFTKSGSITAVSSRSNFTDSDRAEPPGFFNYGVINFTSGANMGLSMEVKEYSFGRIITVMKLPHDIKIGDRYEMIAGCDKSFTSCSSKFANALNFRGEPHLPGLERVL